LLVEDPLTGVHSALGAPAITERQAASSVHYVGAKPAHALELVDEQLG
jgi:hypothetical protein